MVARQRDAPIRRQRQWQGDAAEAGRREAPRHSTRRFDALLPHCAPSPRARLRHVVRGCHIRRAPLSRCAPKRSATAATLRWRPARSEASRCRDRPRRTKPPQAPSPEPPPRQPVRRPARTGTAAGSERSAPAGPRPCRRRTIPERDPAHREPGTAARPASPCEASPAPRRIRRRCRARTARPRPPAPRCPSSGT